MPQESMEYRSRRPSWNSYLTDDDKFKLSKQELLQKKKLLVSKHNILTNSGSCTTVPVKSKVRKVKKTTNKGGPNVKTCKPSEKQVKSESCMSSGPTSLDLLDCEELDSDIESKNSSCHQARTITSVKAVRRKEYTGDSSPLTRPVHTSSGKRPSHLSRTTSTPDASTPSPKKNPSDEYLMTVSRQDMADISSLIGVLHSELRSFEELTGRQSPFDSEVRPLSTPPPAPSVIQRVYADG